MAKKDFMNLMKEKTTDLRPSLLSSEENIKGQITILEPLRDLIPALTSEEQEQLEQNVRRHGIKDPLTIWETTARTAGTGDSETPVFVLIDGHNRYFISQRYKLDFRIHLVRFASLDEVKDYMIDYQLGRRNLTPEQASYLRGMRYLQQKSMRGSNLQAGTPQVNVSETLAKEYGVSSRTIKRDGEFAAGLEKLAPELRKKILAGTETLPKSAINALAKAEPDSPIETVEAILTSTAVADADLSGETALQNEIRKLANGRLDRRTCQRLIAKINELMTLQSSK